jgi:hypothetical protein
MLVAGSSNYDYSVPFFFWQFLDVSKQTLQDCVVEPLPEPYVLNDPKI